MKIQASELSLHHWGVEASEAELPVGGSMPATVEVENEDTGIPVGNGQPFLFTGCDMAGSGHYRQLMGCCTLIIFND